MPFDQLAYQNAYYKANKHGAYGQKQLAYDAKRHKSTRERLFDILGRKCTNPNCKVPGGMDDKRCLQFDHKNGGGYREITGRFKSNSAMYEYYADHAVEARANLQVLCANCNWIKRIEKKENRGQTPIV